MSIWSSLYTATAGITAYGNAMSVVGDNIANVGTTGFKGSRAGFAAILGGIGSNQQRVGAGVVMSGAEVGFGQGSLQQTGRNLDMAVWGDGMFVLDGAHKGVEGDYYTRDGRFTVDQEGYLVNPGNLRLQGYAANTIDGGFSPVLGDLQMESTIPPNPTDELNIQVRLDNGADPANPNAPIEYESSVRVYDDSGRPHDVTIEFVNIAGTNSWDWNATVDSGETATGVSGLPLVIGGGNIAFDPDNTLPQGGAGGNLFVDFAGGGAGININIDFTGSNQYAGGQELRYDQNGYAAGTAEDFQISEDGIVKALYSNGEAHDVGRVALATFTGQSELERMGSQLFRESPGSGNAAIGLAAQGGRGAIQSGTVEGSNVDLGTELVTMITYQRAFQANARAVTTADEMLAETANLKR